MKLVPYSAQPEDRHDLLQVHANFIFSVKFMQEKIDFSSVSDSTGSRNVKKLGVEASYLSDGHDAVLRGQPEHTHGNRQLTILQAIVSDNLQPPHLHKRCYRHAEDGDNKTNSQSL